MKKMNKQPYEAVDGTKYWYLDQGEHIHWMDEKLHREDGPAIEHPDGCEEWYFHGERHRKDGPAIFRGPCQKEWYLNGKQHREDGPAYENEHDDDAKEWWLDGNEVHPEQIVDLWLSRGVFCYYDEKTKELIFGGDFEN